MIEFLDRELLALWKRHFFLFCGFYFFKEVLLAGLCDERFGYILAQQFLRESGGILLGSKFAEEQVTDRNICGVRVLL